MILNDILNSLKNNGNKVFYVNNNEKYTYEMMYKSVKCLYSYLKECHVSKEPVIVFGHKSVFMIVCFLACSFLGIPYVPVDSALPKDRIKDIIDNVNPKVIFNTSKRNFFKNICKKRRILNFYDIINICSKEKNPNLDVKICMKKQDLYYIIFTSGTTGKSKGVKISYENLNSFITFAKEKVKPKESIILNQAPFSFDLSVCDIYLALTTNSTLVVLDKTFSYNINKIITYIKRNRVEIAVFTPTFADILLSSNSFSDINIPTLKKIFFCGEFLDINTVKKIYERFRKIKVINAYGPTECTVAVTSCNITKKMFNYSTLPVGKKSKYAKISIFDENLKLLSEAEVGQIAISGKSVGNGYLNDSVKTNERFVYINSKRYYLTGDTGYFKDDMLYFCGRDDNQIKYKGYRIELDDIKENIERLKYIEKAVVIPIKKDNKVVKLVAYVKLKKDDVIVTKIKEDLSKLIPNYMIPNIITLNQFPININGKLDTKKLEELFYER